MLAGAKLRLCSILKMSGSKICKATIKSRNIIFDWVTALMTRTTGTAVVMTSNIYVIKLSYHTTRCYHHHCCCCYCCYCCCYCNHQQCQGLSFHHDHLDLQAPLERPSLLSSWPYSSSVSSYFYVALCDPPSNASPSSCPSNPTATSLEYSFSLPHLHLPLCPCS